MGKPRSSRLTSPFLDRDDEAMLSRLVKQPEPQINYEGERTEWRLSKEVVRLRTLLKEMEKRG